jgi:dienelactone hydrolase
MKQTFALVLLLVAGIVSAQSIQDDSLRIGRLADIPLLPEPLLLDEGTTNTPIVNNAQWRQKTAWIQQQYQYWVSGSVPPAPKTFHSKLISEGKEDEVTLRMVELSFGAGDKAKMTVELMIPNRGGRLPVFMTQWNHRGWAQIAVRRGYIGCVYAGADGNDDTRNYNEIFPGYDFATLMKRAWGASRVIDYLESLPQVDTARIAITGHSRNGKQSLMAAAFDPRIKAVVSSSGGTGAESTFRFSDERFNAESVEEITRNFPAWFSPRLRLFAGREQKLPVDQNLLMSMIAPRGLMMVSAITEEQGNAWGIEQSYRSVKKAYHFMHADNKVAIRLRPGRHQHAAREVETYLDFFDYIFGRSAIPPENNRYLDYSFAKWKKASGENIDPLGFRSAGASGHNMSAETMNPDTTRKWIRWLLGTQPPGFAVAKPLSPLLTRNRAYPDDYLAEVIGEPTLPEGMVKMEIGPYTPLGDNLWGTMYFPADAVVHDSVARKLPLVIFLHEDAYATGYHRRSIGAIRRFTGQGFAVLAYDMVGFGTRQEEALHFYERYPHWSLMGKMVSDTRSIINDACTRMPFIDTSNIYLTGYSLGGTVAVLTAALEQRVKGTAVISAFTSFRNNDKATEGLALYADLQGLLPRLGFFAKNQDRIPVDFDDVLACIAPRRLLVIAPTQDRHHPASVVQQLITSAGSKANGAASTNWLTFEQPNTYNHYTAAMQQDVADWLKHSIHRAF